MLYGILIGFVCGAAVTLYFVVRKKNVSKRKSVRKDLNKTYEEDF